MTFQTLKIRTTKSKRMQLNIFQKQKAWKPNMSKSDSNQIIH